MTDRDRLAVDLQAADDEWMADPNEDVNADGPHWTVFIAVRLIALGWTWLDEERLARALLLVRPMRDVQTFGDYARQIAKAYREDRGR